MFAFSAVQGVRYKDEGYDVLCARFVLNALVSKRNYNNFRCPYQSISTTAYQRSLTTRKYPGDMPITLYTQLKHVEIALYGLFFLVAFGDPQLIKWPKGPPSEYSVGSPKSAQVELLFLSICFGTERKPFKD